MSKSNPSIEIIDKDNKCKYALIFQEYMRTTAPVNFDYNKNLTRGIERLKKSGKRSIPLTFVAGLEDVGVLGDKVLAKFLLPGPLNIVNTLLLDPQRQDLAGSMGLRIRCILRKVS